VRRLVAALLGGPAAVEGALALGRLDLVLVRRVLRPLLVEDPLGGVEIAVAASTARSAASASRCTS